MHFEHQYGLKSNGMTTIAKKRFRFFAILGSVAVVIASLQTNAGTAPAFKIVEIAPSVFVHEGKIALFDPSNAGDIANIGFVIGNDAVAVIDTGGSLRIGQALLAEIRERTSLPVRFVIFTHMHPDHVFGAEAFKAEDAEFIGHARLAEALTARREQYLNANRVLLGSSFEGTEIVIPAREVEASETIDLGGRVLTLEARTTAHTNNDLTVFDEKTGTMFTGDLLFARHVPALDGSIKGWLKVMDELERRQLARVVPGHGPASMSWPDAIAPQRRYLERIAGEIRDFIQRGKTLAEAAKLVGIGEKDGWMLFDEFNARNVSAAFAELEWE